MRRSRITLVSAVLLALAPSGEPAARAATLPDPSVTGTVLFNLGGRQDLAAFGSIELTDARFGSVHADVSGTPSPSIVASAHIGPNAVTQSLYGRGTGALTYYFEIEGPSGSVPVSIDVAGAATGVATAGASFAVESRWSLYASIALTTVLAGDDIASGQQSGSFDQGFDHTVSLMLATNHTYPVLLVADAQAAATDAGSDSLADAFVDPIFSFGPGVDPLAYSFHFSDGIGNTTVPEPAALSLLGTGCMALGVVGRRRGHRKGMRS